MVINCFFCLFLIFVLIVFCRQFNTFFHTFNLPNKEITRCMQNNRLVLLRYLRMSEQFLHSIRDVDDLARAARDDKQKGVQFL